MPGLEPGIHLLAAASTKAVDGRIKAGHDGMRLIFKLLGKA
jgi:hypothetical protein